MPRTPPAALPTVAPQAAPPSPAAAARGPADDGSGPPRFAQERQQRIAAVLRDRGRVEVAALAAVYEVSEDTIRRDLRQLAAMGLVHKTHGGAVAVNASVMTTQQRADVLPGAKRAIARLALQQVMPHQTLFIDGGTTALALVQLLLAPGAPRPLTVVTHALDAAVALAGAQQLRLVLAGGLWLGGPRIFVGDQALATVRAHRADIAFLGACALHPRTGLTAHDEGEAAIKRAMVTGAARRVVLSDSSKLDTVAACAVAAADEVDLVISNEPAPWLGERLLLAGGSDPAARTPAASLPQGPSAG